MRPRTSPARCQEKIGEIRVAAAGACRCSGSRVCRHGAVDSVVRGCGIDSRRQIVRSGPLGWLLDGDFVFAQRACRWLARNRIWGCCARRVRGTRSSTAGTRSQRRRELGDHGKLREGKETDANRLRRGREGLVDAADLVARRPTEQTS